jgi:hypothetical protein
MDWKLLFGLLALTVLSNKSLAHKEWVHQYTVKQAYLMLEAQIGPVPELRDRIGMTFYGYGDNTYPWATGLVGVGAWREDIEDPVYRYGGPFDGWAASSTHFWRADNGDEATTPIPLSPNAPNALQKARRYLFGGGRIYFALPGVDPVRGIINGYFYSYSSLVHFYRTGQCMFEGYQDFTGTNHFETPTAQTLQQETARRWSAMILGRVAHLLQDMSCPAHGKNDLHPCELGNIDSYELFMGGTLGFPGSACNAEQTTFPAQAWNYTNAVSQGGLLPNLTGSNHTLIIRTLFYNQNQLADHFPSDDDAGNHNLPNGSNSFLLSRYQALGNPPNSVNFFDIANETYVYSIRATASLFYWFCFNAGIIPISTTVKNDFEEGNVIVNSQLVPSGVPFPKNFGDPLTISVTATTQTSGGYTRYFTEWQKKDLDEVIVGTYGMPTWSTSVDGSHIYIAVFNREFNIAIANGQSFEGTVGGTYRVNYGAPVASWSGAFVERVSAPIHVEAVPPSSDWFFVRWSDGSTQNPRDFTPSDHFTVYAQYKQRMASSVQTATASNNQRKMTYFNGAHHVVYESGGEVWYTRSANDGATWSNEVLLSDGSGINKSPSIAVRKGGSQLHPPLGVTWEKFSGGVSDVYLRYLNSDNTWTNPEFIVTVEGEATPVISLDENFETIVYDNGDTSGGTAGIEVYYKDLVNNITHYTFEHVPGTDFESKHPSAEIFSYGNLTGQLGVAWSQKDEIHYTYITYNFGTQTLDFSPTEVVSVGGSYIWSDFPSLTFENVSPYRPAITWQTYDYDFVTTYVIHQRRRESWGWGVTTEFHGGAAFFHPSIMVHPLNYRQVVAWHTDNDDARYYAYDGNSWVNGGVVASNVTNPSIGSDHRTTQIRVAYTGLTSNPYPIVTSNLNFLDGFTDGPDSPDEGREGKKDVRSKSLGIAIGNAYHGAKFKKVSLNGQGGTVSLQLPPRQDTISTNSETQARDFLSFDPVRVSPNSSMRISFVRNSKLLDSTAQTTSGRIALCLQAFDSASNSLLATVGVDTFINSVRGKKNKNVDVSLNQLAGRVVRFKLLPRVLEGRNARWTAIEVHEDSATAGDGLFGGEEYLSVELPRTYQVHQNYPNPFNPSTQINFELPEPSQVSLFVYDVLGRKVAELVSRGYEAGYHSVTWNASNVSTGVYFARFIAVDASGNLKLSKVNKLLLAK